MTPTVIVTGAGGGIGAETALLFAGRGHHVVVADIDRAGAEQVAGRIRDLGGTAWAATVDITDEDRVREVVDLAAADGSLVCVVNNAGRNSAARAAEGHVDSPVADAESAVWEADLQTTLLGTMYVTKYAVRAIAAAGGGAIVNVTSVEAIGGDSTLPAYAAAKAGVIALTRSVAAAYGAAGVRCNAVAPGVIETAAVLRVTTQEFRRSLGEGTSMGRLGRPAEVAELIYFLGTPVSSYVTGQVIAVDGGMTARLPHARPVPLPAGRDADLARFSPDHPGLTPHDTIA